VAIDSEATLDAAVRGGVREVLVDVNVGCRAAAARPTRRPLADRARARGLACAG
jgi:hypothetical protein